MRSLIPVIALALLVGFRGTAIAQSAETQEETETTPSGLRFSLGANLDFGEGLKANSFYGRLSHWAPSFAGAIPRAVPKDGLTLTWAQRLGFYGGVYGNNFQQATQERLRQGSFYDILEFPRADSVRLMRQGRTESSDATFQNLGAFISFPYTVFAKGGSDRTSTFVSIAPLPYEGIWERQTETFKYTDLPGVPDTAMYHVALLDTLETNGQTGDRRYLARNTRRSTPFHTYLGLGDLLMSWHESRMTVLARLIPYGWHFSPGSNTRPFFNLYFTATHQMGLRMGVDLRKDYGSAPALINVFLTKDFDLKTLSEGLFGKPFQPAKDGG